MPINRREFLYQSLHQMLEFRLDSCQLSVVDQGKLILEFSKNPVNIIHHPSALLLLHKVLLRQRSATRAAGSVH